MLFMIYSIPNLSPCGQETDMVLLRLSLYICQNNTMPRKILCTGTYYAPENTMPRKIQCTGTYYAPENTMPQKMPCPGKYYAPENTIPGKYYALENTMQRKKITWKYCVPHPLVKFNFNNKFTLIFYHCIHRRQNPVRFRPEKPLTQFRPQKETTVLSILYTKEYI